MAELPNALTDVLRGKSPDDMYAALQRERCLSPAGVAARSQVISVIEKAAAAARHDQARGTIGGTVAYCVVGALLRDGYLNERARQLLGTVTYESAKRWWKFW